MALGELLAGEHEDPSTAAARNIDWEEFLGSHDHRYTPVVMAAAEGDSMRSLKGMFGISDSGMSNLKRRLAAEIRESMGDVLADVTRRPHWRGCIAAEHEKVACRAERRN